MLCGLSRQGDVPFRHLVVGKEVVEGAADAALQGCRTAHARSERHVAREGDIESLHLHAELAKLLHHAVDEACPGGARTLRIVHLELHAVLQVDGIAHDGVEAIGAHLGHNALVHGAREDEAPVVVRVLADEVDATRREVYVACLTIEMLDKTASHKFYVHIFCLCNI